MTRVQELAKALMAEHGLTQKGWVLTLDNSVSRAGCCSYTSKTISLSKHLVRMEKHELADVENILLHEIAHALAGPGQGHGKEWKEIAVKIGCDGQRCHSLELKPHPHVLACVMCGHVNALRHRICRKFWNNRKCSSCDVQGSVTVLPRQSWETIERFTKEAHDVKASSTQA